MAGNDATTAELFPGWSSVVHQPADEPEETDLPSTVDIAAFSSGLTVEPSRLTQDDDNSDSDSDSEADSSNSTDASQSCSQSDSSDSDSSSSSQESSSRSPSPQEFSVTSSQTNGLRLTIAPVRKPSPTNERPVRKQPVPIMKPKLSSSSSSDSSDSESDSDRSSDKMDAPVKSEPSKAELVSSKSEGSSGRSSVKNVRRPLGRLRTRLMDRRDKEERPTEKVTERSARVTRRDTQVAAAAAAAAAAMKNGGKGRQRPRRTKKMASLPLSRSSNYSTSDSEDSDANSAMLASCSLQEIRQEDLAAILPDQQEIDPFNDFECNHTDKTSPVAGDMSGSDMELPQQAVNALIQRTTESSSESECHPPPNPSTLCANSLLQQFVAQTQMLNAPCPPISAMSDTMKPPQAQNVESQTGKVEATENVKRRRGRPRKGNKENNKDAEKTQEYCTNPNVSPDSGIQNSPDHVSSPEPTLTLKKPATLRKVEKSSVKKLARSEKPAPKSNSIHPKVNNSKAPTSSKFKTVTKTPVTANRFDRVLYANTDRVLYPPRRGRPPTRKHGRPGRPAKNKPQTPESQETKRPQMKSEENTSKSVKGKTKSRPVLTTKNKSDGKLLHPTLKIPSKFLHSKRHKHKHKRLKLKILKPMIACDPKINLEIEKLIADFVKYCAIATKQPKENVPEQILKTLKKVTKKRKTTENIDKKKKKASVSTMVNKVNNSNEQRLPLKKRHYHLLSNGENKNDAEELSAEAVEDKSDKTKTKQTVVGKSEKPKNSGSSTPKSEKGDPQKPPKYVPVIKSNASPKLSNINNNEYETKDCVKNPKTFDKSHIDEAIEACINRFSNDKTVTKQDPTLSEEKLNITGSSITATTPKKRHRLEMISSPEKSDPTVEEKVKPKITIESFISELKAKRNIVAQTPTIGVKKEHEEKEEKVLKKSVEQGVKVSPEGVKKKVRKRRAINRTGFPSVKKKKKKLPPVEPQSIQPDSSKPSNSCDRVPKEGEEYTKFVERTESRDMSPSSTQIDKSKNNQESGPKWEMMSECESLPQEERIDFEDDAKPERMILRQRDHSPATSVDTRTSKSKSEDQDCDIELSLESSIERLRSRLEEPKKRKRSKDKMVYPKRRVRDSSPASSIEPLIERRLKEERASASGDEKKYRKAPRWRKKYLIAGLFSDYFKEDDESVRQKRTENAHKYSRLVYNPEEHPFGLLPPPYHCGRYLRCRTLHFQLPYDLWWQHTHSQLPGRDIVPSWNYKKVRTNVYNVKTTTGACEPQACNCKPSSNCGDDCINRLVLSECPASHRCLNQKIQRHEWAPGLEKFMTESKGWGVRTKLPIKNGEFILEYVGEVVADQEFKERMGTIYAQDTHHYCLHLDGGLVIDGHRMGGDGRFVNHSCAPNCEMQKWSVNGQFRMALFALRDIKGGEELTYDYNFSLFNPADGQECKCGSESCRGVIGGKSQRLKQIQGAAATVVKNPGRVGRPRKKEAKKKANTGSPHREIEKPQASSAILPLLQVKPMSQVQKGFILEHHCFLLRNLAKVRKVRDRTLSTALSIPRQQTSTPTNSAFMNHLNALQKPRNIKTRRLAQAEDDPELSKTVKLAALLKEILTAVSTAKDEKGEVLSAPFMVMPSKRKVPEFYTRISDPIDLSTIEQNIETGYYKSPSSFDEDFNKLFRNYIRFYGRTSQTGISATKLKTVYNETKRQSLTKYEDALGEKPPSTFASNRKKSEEEDIIRCICGIPRDEGLMIQCERCLVWQHCECVKADASTPSYHCEICVPRKVDYEIPMDEFTEHGHRYYMTLMRGDLQLRQGDTVYVLRDIPIEGTSEKHTYLTIGKIDYSELDIFRIERLWKEEKTGRRLAYGHHYLRPHETFHEPTRKFFSNEVMRVPLYEAVPVELIITHCWVMDINTFCKGRPIGASEEHIYICEYRVDKGAKMFSKVAKSKFPICTKSFAFECFDTRLKITRTYCPHDVDEALIKHTGRKQKTEESQMISNNGSASHMNNVRIVSTLPVMPPVVRTRAEQKAKLNKILLNLLSQMPTKQALDLSYLLEGGRRRKKNETSNK